MRGRPQMVPAVLEHALDPVDGLSERCLQPVAEDGRHPGDVVAVRRVTKYLIDGAAHLIDCTDDGRCNIVTDNSVAAVN